MKGGKRRKKGKKGRKKGPGVKRSTLKSSLKVKSIELKARDCVECFYQSYKFCITFVELHEGQASGDVTEVAFCRRGNLQYSPPIR